MQTQEEKFFLFVMPLLFIALSPCFFISCSVSWKWDGGLTPCIFAQHEILRLDFVHTTQLEGKRALNREGGRKYKRKLDRGKGREEKVRFCIFCAG